MPAAVKKASRKEQILEVFNGFPEPTTIKEVAVACLSANVWSKDMRDKMVFRAACESVRKVLNDFDVEEGCPNALIKKVEIESNEDGEVTEVQVFVQKLIWEPSHALTWIVHRVKQLKEDRTVIERFLRYCEARWPQERNWWDLYQEEMSRE